MTLTPVTLDQAAWNTTLAALPAAHILQTWEWGEFKRVTTGWIPQRFAWQRDGRVVAMASVGVRRFGPFPLMYAPKGPALDYGDPSLVGDVLEALQTFARRSGAVWLKIDPDVVAATGVPGEPDDAPDATGSALMTVLQARGWHFSRDQVQFRNTITLDLKQPEEALLAALSQSTRRKLRIAERAGVAIREGSAADIPTLYALYEATGQRDAFLIRPAAYYEEAWRRFMDAGLAVPLIAEADGQPVAAVILFAFGRTCWYFYGMSADTARELQPNVLLQWHAIRRAQAQGYAVYDFWGAPDVFDESDRMWGVYQFKRGFHGTVTRHVGAWDYAPSAIAYAAYARALPRVRAMLRRG